MYQIEIQIDLYWENLEYLIEIKEELISCELQEDYPANYTYLLTFNEVTFAQVDAFTINPYKNGVNTN